MKLSACRPSAAEVSAMLLLYLCLTSAVGASVSKLSFESTKRCPTRATTLLAQRLTSKLRCAAICSSQNRCDAFYFHQPSGRCFHGDACSTLAQWTDGDCDSYKYTDVLCGDCDVAKPVFTELQMKLFYKFSRSGLVNEVNPRLFCLTAHNVTVDAGGAHFEGNTGSYLSTETPGFAKFLQFGAEHSAFVRVRHVFASGLQYYHKFLKCGAGFGNSFIRSDNAIYDSFKFYQSGNAASLRSYSPPVLPTDGLQREISVGYAFNRTAHQHFYLNGSISAVDSFSTESASYSQSLFDCLNLGQSTSDDNCLNGTMLCYGLSTKALSLSEFQKVQLLCDDG